MYYKRRILYQILGHLRHVLWYATIPGHTYDVQLCHCNVNFTNVPGVEVSQWNTFTEHLLQKSETFWQILFLSNIISEQEYFYS